METYFEGMPCKWCGKNADNMAAHHLHVTGQHIYEPAFHLVDTGDECSPESWTVMPFPGTDGPAFGAFDTVQEGVELLKSMCFAYNLGKIHALEIPLV